ncbi:methyltransferase type 11 [Grosmannia clavigera kw1407]|uniref:Methyltransferase type 11 n=1 Tax=Grosmannia clavigera (strain kw1407 / UAMH 11150) TaxID=655863 RepID=F0XCR9_GROCL|nr:methyltransferase type 11 [Grosmannia clavigera kw1407]EFX04383.1 methyltransferase type 11 [Grosmannia clavigera kw1407]
MADAGMPSSEKTFRGYSAEQGQKYARARPGYPVTLYDAVAAYHVGHGGRLDTLLDVGCGPGTVVGEFGGRFRQAIGIDPSAGMISATREKVQGAAVRFEVSTAEALGADHSPPLVADGSVDVITAATAAHWFDMAGFWTRAAQVLRPGGTVALWCVGGGPLRLAADVPAGAAIQALIDGFDAQLHDYMVPGNWIVRNSYTDLVLPWSSSSSSSASVAAVFDETTFIRQPWCTSADPAYGYGPDYAVYPSVVTAIPLRAFERIVETGSPITRWREAHPDLVGTENDIVRQTFIQIERLMQAAGVKPGCETISGAYAGVLLLVRKKD